MKVMPKVSTIILLAALVTLGACSQARRSIYAGQGNEELWTPVSLCTVNVPSSGAMGCFSVQLSIDRNLAYFDVQELGFAPGTVPYRILARPAGASTFQLLADNVTTPVGGTVEVKARNGMYIENYEEWRVELTRGKDSTGLNFQMAPAGTGLPVAQAVLYFEELDDVE